MVDASAVKVEKTRKIVIVGAGVFGLSTADHLVERGYTSITILDRASILPAPDAASCDINKVVRSSYADMFYSRLAKEATDLWKDTSVWGDTYHESGVFVVRQPGTFTGAYSDKSYDNDRLLGARIEDLGTPEAIRAIFPQDVPTVSFEGTTGYLNWDGGWAAAAQGIEILLNKVKTRGVEIFAGKAVVDLIKNADSSQTCGVKCADGSVYDADLVVVASGSWTPSSFSKLDLHGKCLATGQTVATIQLTPKEGDRYRACPVILDFTSGFYMFPPNADNIVKLAIHSNGYLYRPVTPNASSTPRTWLSHGDDGLRIPKEVVLRLRGYLRQIYPELAEKPFSGTRMCWYTQSPDDDWVIGYHPNDPAVVLATSGSGHAYKFLPNIGRLVADAIEGKLEPELVKKFAVERKDNVHTVWRFGEPAKELDLGTLCNPEDLLP